MLGNTRRFLNAQCLFLLLLTLSTPISISAQTPLRFSLGVAGYSTNLITETDTGEQRLTGFSGGATATAGYGRIGLDLRYIEGSLSQNGGGESRDVVEGEAMLLVRALSWLSLKLGPHIRSFIQNNATERWLFWEMRFRTELPLGTRRVTGAFEFWQVLSGDVNTADPFDGGQGIQGNLSIEISSLPVKLNLGYRIDRSNLGGSARAEVFERAFLGIGVGRNNSN